MVAHYRSEQFVEKEQLGLAPSGKVLDLSQNYNVACADYKR